MSAPESPSPNPESKSSPTSASSTQSDEVKPNTKQFILNLKKFLIHTKVILEEFSKIDPTVDISKVSNDINTYFSMFNLTSVDKDIPDWEDEHSQLFTELFEEYSEKIRENPPTPGWLINPHDQIKITFGTSEYARNKFKNGHKPLKLVPVIWLSDLVDKAEKVSTHHRLNTENELELIKQNTPQIKYYDYLMLYLYNIFYNNSTSKDDREQLLHNIHHFEIRVGSRKAPSMGGGGGGGFIDNLMNFAGPMLGNVLPEGERQGISDTINNVLKNETTQNLLGGLATTIQSSMEEEGGLNVGRLLGDISQTLDQGSIERIAEVARESHAQSQSSKGRSVPQ